MVKKYLINLSGHPTPEKKVKGYIVVSLPVQLDIDTHIDELEKYFYEEAHSIYTALDEDVKKAVAVGNYALLLPGLTPFAATILAYFHGISGHFPKIFLFVRTPEGFVLKGPIDLQNYRELARWHRPFPIKK